MKRALLCVLLSCGGSGANDNGADAATDTSIVDAIVRDLHVEDISVGDAGPDGDSGAAGCVPGDVTGYTPSWHPPTAPESRCTNAELDQLISSCTGATFSQSLCDAFRLAHPLCFACVFSRDTAPRWGAIVESSLTTLIYGNANGCLALETGDQTTTSCAAKGEAAQQCTQLACGPNCPAQTQAQIDALNACTFAAADGGCASYVSASTSCWNALLAGGGAGAVAVQLCSSDTYGNLVDYGRALAGIFCGPQGDGGADGGSTGAADGGPVDAANDGG